MKYHPTSTGVSKHWHIVQFGGGAASFAVAAHVVEKYGEENTILLFCDTLIEDEDLYRFTFETVKILGCYFYYCKDGRDPWQVFEDVRYMGNTRTAHCSQILKKELARIIIDQDFGPENCTLYFGFDWKESHRHDKAVNNWLPYNVVSPLCAPPFLSRQQVFNVLDDYGIEPPELYGLGFTHNNCGGFCVRAGQAHFANLLKTKPKLYAYHEGKQEALFKLIPTTKPFLRMTINKVLTYLSLKQFRKHIQCGSSFDKLDFGGCGCFSDD